MHHNSGTETSPKKGDLHTRHSFEQLQGIYFCFCFPYKFTYKFKIQLCKRTQKFTLFSFQWNPRKDICNLGSRFAQSLLLNKSILHKQTLFFTQKINYYPQHSHLQHEHLKKTAVNWGIYSTYPTFKHWYSTFYSICRHFLPWTNMFSK